MKSNGILLLGHGTPSDAGTQAFLEFVQLVEAMAGDMPVAVGFMEFASPTIVEGVGVLNSRGVLQVAAVPVFLSGAGHTADDLPECIAQAKQVYHRLKIELTPHVGSHPKVAELSALRYKEAIADRAEVPAEETLTVIVAHGSPEAEAFEELERFAATRQNLTPDVHVTPCFSQMGVPLLKDVLPTLAGPTFKRIVVQPHFLLKGRLVDAIVKTAASVAEKNPDIEFIVTEPLGGHHLLAEAVLDLGRSGE